jgi:PKD repeat protein
VSYIWNFGDGKSRTVQTASVDHVFEKVGVYKVTLLATSAEGDKNTVSTMIYIGENEAPIGVYNVLGPNNQLLLPTDECDGESAYSVTRYQQMTIDSSQSVDIK